MDLTIKDIAKMADVSVSTVSRVINNSKPVNPQVKERVSNILFETGFKPNALARGLIYKKTGLIGVIVPQMNNSASSSLIDGIEAVAQRSGYNIIVSNSRSDEAKELQFLNIFKERQLEGVLFSGVEITQRHYQTIEKLNIPTVILSQKSMNENIPWVGFDNYKAGRDMMDFIIRYGHRKIGMIHGPLRDISAGADRYNAYKDTLNELAISINDDWVVESDFTLTGGYKAMEKILQSKEIPTAVYCANDTIAIGAMNCALDFGYDVPENISITGFDDIEMASAVKPQLTTVRLETYQVGYKAFELLTNRINGKQSDYIDSLVEHRLIIRKSTRRLN